MIEGNNREFDGLIRGWGCLRWHMNSEEDRHVMHNHSENLKTHSKGIIDPSVSKISIHDLVC